MDRKRELHVRARAVPETYLANILLGASESVDIMLVGGTNLMEDYPIEAIATLVDQRLQRRCAIPAPEYWQNTLPGGKTKNTRALYNKALEIFRNLDWEVTTFSGKPSLNCLLVDKQSALITDFVNGVPCTPYHYIKEDVLTQALQEHFERIWSQPKGSELIYEDLLHSSIPDITNRIIVASNENWEEIISYLGQHPSQLYQMSPRKFEELIAEMLVRNGMLVKLTPKSKDGGRDILAWANTLTGRHLYLVECKRYAKDRPVGVGLVRALYGIVEAEKATAGWLVTTSRFTRDALSFHKSVEYRLSLKDYGDLVKWLQS